MKLSIFTTGTNPLKRGDLVTDNFLDLADEIIYVDGAKHTKELKEFVVSIKNKTMIPVFYYWPKEFDWLQISRSYQKGYDACTGDWALFADLDFLFHEKDFNRIRQVMENNSHAPALSFYKWQFIQPDRYNLKSRRVIAINKKLVGDRIKMNGGGDLCQTTLDGKHLTPNDVPESGIPFYNYEKILKTKEQITDDVGRMERAYKRHFGKSQYGDGDVFEQWMKAQVGKFAKPQKKITLEEHPKYIQQTIRDLKPHQFGYNGFNNFAEGYHS